MQISALGQSQVLKRASALLEERKIAGMWPGTSSTTRPCRHPVDILRDALSLSDCAALENATTRVISLAESAASFVSLLCRSLGLLFNISVDMGMLLALLPSHLKASSLLRVGGTGPGSRVSIPWRCL